MSFAEKLHFYSLLVRQSNDRLNCRETSLLEMELMLLPDPLPLMHPAFLYSFIGVPSEILGVPIRTSSSILACPEIHVLIGYFEKSLSFYIFLASLSFCPFHINKCIFQEKITIDEIYCLNLFKMKVYFPNFWLILQL